MNFDEARFQTFLSELGLRHSTAARDAGIRIIQGTVDTVIAGNDTIKIKDGEILSAALRPEGPRINFSELESVLALSEKIKAQKFPYLEIHISLQQGNLSAVWGKIAEDLPAESAGTHELTGIPASTGKVEAPCAIVPPEKDIRGKIIVLKNARDIGNLLKERPAGIILEEGSLLSHASILAREAQIPAIVMVSKARQTLKSGEIVLLDATIGRVTKRK